ncbi:MAG: TonB-dependent receptor [Prevotellaceae bacterium]|jgi:TonB-linked SusC/RagA family outer membrane protein|nr:TonB-dependent receptor [Prevotellaceae bacterium]
MKQLLKRGTIRTLFSTVLFTGLLSISAYAQQGIRISGLVYDDENELLAGVNVTIRGTSTGVATDANGGYILTVPSDTSVLVFSLIGYHTAEVEVGDRRTILVALEKDIEEIGEVAVVAFGRQKKESVVGAIQTISPRELKIPSSSLSNAFAGKIAGVIAVQRSGEPGADGSNFWIRGISTFAGNTSPLIFIDGVEVSTGDMNALPPEVIEGFSVLKDATATALYGARGANGVMLITTRQGRNLERARINIRLEGQMTMPTQTVEMADGVTYMEMFNEARRTRGADLVFADDKIENTRLGKDRFVFPNVNWQKMLFKDASYNQTVNMNVTGGGSRVTYFMSVSINNDNGMLRSDPQNVYNSNIHQQRYSFQGNIAADLTETTKATVRLNTQILNYGGSRISSATLYGELFLSPGVLFPAYFPNTDNSDHILFGNREGGPHPAFGANLYHNPYAEMVRGYNERNENTNIVSFELEQDLKFFTQGLKARGLVSFKNWSNTSVTRAFDPTFYQIASATENPDGSYSYTLSPALNKGTSALSTSTSSTGDRYMNIQLSMDYARTFGNHDVGAMVVYLQRDYRSNNPNNDYYATLPTRNQGVAGRLTYGYDGRYLAEANFGYNGSETFQDGNRFGFFPSFALGYNISNEDFWLPLKSAVSNFKIRGSWGIVGNSAISGRFPYLSFVNLTGRSYTFGNNWQTTRSGASITRYGADGASWEEGHKLNLGVDITLMRSLYITADFFREKRRGIFMQYNTLPVESGISSDLRPYANLGKVENKGMDISVDYNRAFLNNELIVNIRGNFTYAVNTLIDRDEPQLPFEYMSNLGKPLNRNRGLIALGLFRDQADIDGSPNQTFSPVLPGDIKYKDMNGDNQIDGNDMTQLGEPTIPQIVYGFGVSASYKGFDFSVMFQGAAKTSIMIGDIHPFNQQYSQLYRFIADDVWTEANPNPDAKYPRMVAFASPNAHNNHQSSTYWLRDGAFMRLKHLEIGYTYRFARFYLSGLNLLTFSPFKHWDPELNAMDSGNGYTSTRARGLTYPTLRTFSAGLQFTF